MINIFILAGCSLDFVELGTLEHQIDATGREIGMCFHRPQSERDIEKLSQRVVMAEEGGRIFFQLLELRYEKDFPITPLTISS